MAKESTRDDLTKSYAEMNRLRIDEKKNQLATEFTRYKQDCRKRALDLANQELMSDKAMYNKNATWEEGKRGNDNGDGWQPPKTDVLALADKYYNWLISIPEK